MILLDLKTKRVLFFVFFPLLLSSNIRLPDKMMNSTSTQFVASRRMGLYEPMHQLGMWADFQGNGCMNASPTTILEVDTKLDNQVLYFAS